MLAGSATLQSASQKDLQHPGEGEALEYESNIHVPTREQNRGQFFTFVRCSPWKFWKKKKKTDSCLGIFL